MAKMHESALLFNTPASHLNVKFHVKHPNIIHVCRCSEAGSANSVHVAMNNSASAPARIGLPKHEREKRRQFVLRCCCIL